MNTRNGKEARQTRQREATERQAERDKRTDQQQIDRLRANGHGDCKEVHRLKARLTVA